MKTSCSFFRIAGALLFAAAAGASAQNKPAGQFHSLKDLLDLVPKKTMQEWKMPLKSDAARRAADEIFLKEAKTKIASLKVKAAAWEPSGSGEEGSDKYRMVVGQALNVNGVALQANIWIYFPADQGAALSQTPRGQEVTVAGELGNVEIKNDSAGLRMVVNLVHAKIGGR